MTETLRSENQQQLLCIFAVAFAIFFYCTAIVVLDQAHFLAVGLGGAAFMVALGAGHHLFGVRLWRWVVDASLFIATAILLLVLWALGVRWWELDE